MLEIQSKITPLSAPFLFIDGPHFTFSLNSRVPTSEEASAAKNAKTLQDLDAALAPLHKSIPTGSLVLFEAPSDLMGGRNAVLGNHRTVFFGAGSDAKAIVSLVREKALGEEDVAKMAAAVEKPKHGGSSAATSDR